MKQHITKFDYIDARRSVEIRNMYAYLTNCASKICTFEIWFKWAFAFTLR